MNWETLRYHPVQQAAWRSTARFVGIHAGRGSGKTMLAKRKLALEALKPTRDRRLLFYVAPTTQQAKRIAWDDMLELLDGYVARVMISDSYIETVVGHRLYVCGLDKPERIEGKQYAFGVCDESSDLKSRAFERSILPALIDVPGGCWRIGIGKRHGPSGPEFRQWCVEAPNVADREVFTWPSGEIANAQVVAAARHGMDARDYLEQFGGDWSDGGGGIYHAFHRAHNVRPCAYDPHREIVVGMDFNVDPMCWTLAHDYGSRLEVFAEVFLRDTNTPAALDVLHGRYPRHRSGWAFYGDAAGRGRHTNADVTDYALVNNDPRFIEAGRTINYPRANPRIATRFATVNALLCNADNVRRLYVDPGCVHLIRDLEGLAYIPGTNDPDTSGNIGHMADALGYPIMFLYPMPVVATVGSVGVYDMDTQGV